MSYDYGYADKFPLHWACLNGDLAGVRILIGHGYNVNARDEVRDTPLHGAASRGHNEIVQLLFDHGANLWLKNLYKKTPYDEAVAKSSPSRVLLDTLKTSPKGVQQQALADDMNSTNPTLAVMKWDPVKVTKWMAGLNLSKDYSSLILTNFVDGEVLIDMISKEDWSDLGIRTFGDVKKLIRRQRQLIHG